MALSYLIKPDPHCLPPTTAMIDEVPDDTATNQVPLLGSQVHQTLKPPKYHWYASRYLCLISILVFLCFCGKHTFDRTRAYLARRRRQNVSPGKLVYPHRSSVRMVCGQMVQKWALLTVLPGWLYGPDSVVDAVFTTAYCGLLFFFSLNHSRCKCHVLDQTDSPTGLGGTQNGANQMGVMVWTPQTSKSSLLLGFQPNASRFYLGV